jgi:XTP/dITP diphosphohydrolase
MTTFPHHTSGSDPIDIVIATGNPGKLTELRALLGPAFRVRSIDELQATLPDETGTTFAENAVLKAVSVAKQTGMVAIADDSGLEVAALDGAPGVYSARYAGSMASDADNRNKLLQALSGVDGNGRGARFVCSIAIAFTPDDVVTAEGTCEGIIALNERGRGGFGYDSIFQLASGKTMAELSAEEKNAISHRGKAMSAALRLLQERLSVPGVPLQGGGS